MSVVLAFIFGVIFVTALLVFVLFVPNPTPQQFEVIRIILALAAGGIAAMIPGLLKLQLGMGNNLTLRAGGALAVFAIVYFYSPAHWAPSNATGITQTTNGPAILGNNNKIIFNDVDARALKHLNDQLDEKDLAIDQKIRDAEGWARKYRELNQQLTEARSQVAAKGEDATALNAAQGLLREGNLDDAAATNALRKFIFPNGSSADINRANLARLNALLADRSKFPQAPDGKPWLVPQILFGPNTAVIRLQLARAARLLP